MLYIRHENEKFFITTFDLTTNQQEAAIKDKLNKAEGLMRKKLNFSTTSPL